MTVQSNTQAISPNVSTSFQGVAGTPPYTYAVLPGGAGGVIGALTGIYTAPTGLGTDTIEVTDSLAAVATLDISVLTHLELLADIIQKEMQLLNGRVYLWDQKINQPKDSELYIAVGVISCRPFGNSNKMNDLGESVQSVNMLATVSIDIISRGPEARDRKEEIILALNSDYAHSQQELNSFRIATLPSSFVNLSQEDGAAIPYRFNISVNLQYAVTKIKAVPYFDDFEVFENPDATIEP